MKLTKSQLKELIKQAIVEDIFDKEIKNPKTGNMIKLRTALQLPDEHPANKKAKDMVAKTPTKDDDKKDTKKGKIKADPFGDKGRAADDEADDIDRDAKFAADAEDDKPKYRHPAMNDLDWDEEIPPEDLEGFVDDNKKKLTRNTQRRAYDYLDKIQAAHDYEDYDDAVFWQKRLQKTLDRYMQITRDDKKRTEIKESTRRKYTIKEVRMWMKKLEENRYKKVYNSDARRVAWMVNNEGVELSEMPKSMSKKWTKAQYGRERYLATEFLKSKSEQLSETKFYAFFNKKKHTIDGKSLYDAKQKAILKLKVPKSKVGMLSIVNAKEHDRGGFRFEQKLRESIREIIKEQLNEYTGAGKPIPRNKAKQLFVPEKEMIRFSRVFKKLIQKGFVYIGDQTKEKKKISKHYTVTVDKKMYDNLLDILMSKRFEVKT